MIDITEFIPIGRANAVTGSYLASKLHIPERDVRKLISHARREEVIINLQDGKGFFKPAESEGTLVEFWLKQESSRLKEHAMSLRASRRYVKEHGLKHPR